MAVMRLWQMSVRAVNVIFNEVSARSVDILQFASTAYPLSNSGRSDCSAGQIVVG